MSDIPAGPLPSAIAERAAAAGIVLDLQASRALAAHAKAVLEANERLHLTAITDPADFLERHLGEAFEGAALLPNAVSGLLLDLGSGNGYPGIPLAISRPRMTPVLAEASMKKAAFLRDALLACGVDKGQVLEKRVDRAADLDAVPPLAVLATRAMGGWERIVPKLVAQLAPGGVVLLWAGANISDVLARKAWSRLRLTHSRELPGRDRARVFALVKNDQ